MSWLGSPGRQVLNPVAEPHADRRGVNDQPQAISLAPAWTPDPAASTLEAMLAAADAAHKRGDWVVADAAWQALRVRFPDLWYPYTGAAAALRELGRLVEASQLLIEAATRFPGEPTILHELGHLAVRSGLWPLAEQAWRGAAALDAPPWWIFTEWARAVAEQGRGPDAEAILLAGLAREPDEIAIHINYAQIADRREDWPEAVKRWAAVHARFPAAEAVANGLYRAMLRLAESDPAAADTAQLALRTVDAGDDMLSLLLAFESLGGTGPAGGCEFGGVQRDNGAEPLGLFRWATVSPSSLIACLNARFATLGDAATTTVYLDDDDPHRLWQIGDTAYGTSMHSFVSSAEVPHERMVALAQKRTRYLARKLIADLEAAEKIFVLKLGDRRLTPAEATELSRVVRSYGPGELLCVCPEDAVHPAETIVAVAPGIFVASMDFSGERDAAPRQPAWIALCRAMLHLHQRGMAGLS